MSFLEGDPGGTSQCPPVHHKCSLRTSAKVGGPALQCDHVLHPFSPKNIVT